jgi:tetratricopeptide (TPR) repeat protein
LERYQQEPTRDDLATAEQRLAECVRRYPNDLIPKFYLGSVRTLTGYHGLDGAIQLLQEVALTGGTELTFAARYNLAIAHIEQYNETGFAKAEEILKTLESGEVEEPAGVWRRVRQFWTTHFGRSARELDRYKGVPSRQRMLWSSRAILLYTWAHRLWKTRFHPAEGHTDALQGLKVAFDSFSAAYERSPFKDDPGIQAEFWNALATYYETRAHLEPDAGFGQTAKQHYERALSLRPGYIGYRSNVARLLQEVLGQPKEARVIWNELLEIWPEGHYIHLNLGRLDRAEGNRAGARLHLTKAAEKIPEAKDELDAMNREDGATDELLP